MTRSMAGKVCIVTGATRGIGKGIALQLGQAGATVYITGRTLTARKGDPVGGSLTETANQVEERGGKCIPVQCDHSKDSDIEDLFKRVSAEQDGRLDLLVNNAYAAVTAIADNMGKPFWEQPIDMWDTVNNVGLRNHYMCTVYASRLMTVRKTGLIVNISSPGGLRYLFNVPYGVGKEAMDRMAADCAVELKKMKVAIVSLWPSAVRTESAMHIIKTKGDKINEYAPPDVDRMAVDCAVELRKLKVACVSLWPGPVPTENITVAMKSKGKDFDSMSPGLPKVDATKVFANGETPEYVGKAVVALATDSNIMKKSGKVLLTTDLGYEYGFKDVDGKQPANIRQVNSTLALLPGTAWLAKLVPDFIYIPKWMMSFAGHKL